MAFPFEKEITRRPPLDEVPNTAGEICDDKARSLIESEFSWTKPLSG
jgi:hypothetical protein